MYAFRCYGKKMFVQDKFLGYISIEGMLWTFDGYKFGELTEYGDIYIQGVLAGHINSENEIIIHEQKYGVVSADFNLIFDIQPI